MSSDDPRYLAAVDAWIDEITREHVARADRWRAWARTLTGCVGVLALIWAVAAW